MRFFDGYSNACNERIRGHQKIRASSHPDAVSVPIIAMTANAFTEDVSLSLSAGMNAHLSKPLDMLCIYKLLEQTFKGKEKTSSNDKKF